MTPREVLTKARDLLKERGWIQGELATDSRGVWVPSYSTKATAYCSIGAVEAAIGRKYNAHAADLVLYNETTNYLRKAVPGRNNGIISYNDDPGRTKEEVIDMFNNAIRKAEDDDE